MALTKEDIQMIKKIVDTNVHRYMNGKPYVLSITYEELQKEIFNMRNDIPDIPIVRIE